MEIAVMEELEDLKERLINNKMETEKTNDFIDQWEYEDDYSGNEIRDMQEDFRYHAKKYLQENYKGQYAIYHGIICIHIATIEFLNNEDLRYWTLC